jgi:hypothetical protein
LPVTIGRLLIELKTAEEGKVRAEIVTIFD